MAEPAPASMRPGDFSPGNVHRAGAAEARAGREASMRPGDFSPGNQRMLSSSRPRPHLCFNEAGGFLPRKHAGDLAQPASGKIGFNEAGGFLPRKHSARHYLAAPSIQASMRPGDFSPGNVDEMASFMRRRAASMRPGDFSPGNVETLAGLLRECGLMCFNEAGGFLPRKHIELRPLNERLRWLQ